jgi:thiol-disulfide isomerase/thioredoxin
MAAPNSTEHDVTGDPNGSDDRGTRAKRRSRVPFGLPPMLFLSTIVGSLAIALLLASWIVPDDQPADPTVDVEDLLQSELRSSAEGRAVEGEPAPATTFELLDGGSGSLSDFGGRPVVLNFWASSCAPCLKEMPAFEQVHQDLGDRVAIVGVDVSEGVDPGRAMVERTGVSYLQARDPRGDLLRAYGGIQLPHTVVIDAEGVVRELRNQALDEDQIRELVTPLTTGG